MMTDRLEITVEVPGGMKASWEPMSYKSAVHQAKLEAERGALVSITRNGVVVWTNHDGKMQ
jgi:hypothetical protein